MTTVERRDDRLGLAICRTGFSGRTLVTYARDHVLVRTPSKPDYYDGNVLDLVSPPAAHDLGSWVERFRNAADPLGVRHTHLRWEEPLEPSAPAAPAGAPSDVADAAASLGLQVNGLTALLLDEPLAPPSAPGQIVPVAPPSEADTAIDRRWHAAPVLYRYFEGEDPDAWRTADEAFIGWTVEVQRELALEERCQVWLTMRHGAPVARLHVVHDQQGLAAVEDVVVHPVHRQVGIGAALVHRAVAVHREVYPGSRVGIVAEAGSPAERLYRRLGFRPHARLWTAFARAG